MANTQNIFVGTSGYVFPDWAGTFYPRGLERDLWLRYYIEFFSALELNTTFYAIPSLDDMERMASRLPENYHLHIKIPQTLTHHKELTQSEVEHQLKNLSGAVVPLQEKGVVKGFLAQFPISFKNDYSNTEFLKRLLAVLPKPVFIEFRNAQWLDAKVEKLLNDNNAGWVIPDAPNLQNLTQSKPVMTGDTGYIRLHGRNAKDWYSKAKDKDRYNYSYPDDELDEIMNIAKALIHKGGKKVYVYFNNCYHGQAAANARMFAEMMGLISKQPVLI